MSLDQSLSELARLRETVARIESGQVDARNVAARRRRRDAAPVRLGDGSLPLDRVLSGGLRRGALHEVVASRTRDDAAAAGFALGVAGRCAGAGPLVWIVEDCAAFETGAPYRPGLVAHGIDPDRLVLVRTGDARATLWAIEEALRLRACAVLAELWGTKHYGLAPSRRLLLAAQAGGGIVILLHAGLAGRGATLSSAAETRFAVASCPSPRAPSAGHRTPIPGAPAVTVRLLKLRLGAAANDQRRSLDRDHALVWNVNRRCFDAHPLPVGVPAVPADRPAEASRGERRGAAVVGFGRSRAG